MPTDSKIIYLTFDDGPTPKITEWTLNILKDFQAKATFFCEGKKLLENLIIVNKVIKDGHSIGNHSYSHVNGWKTNTIDYIQDIEKAREVIVEKTKASVSGLLFRPPYGKIKSTQANALMKKGYKIVMLDVVSGDFDQNVNPERSLQKVLKHTKSGSIVVFHDSEKAFRTLKYVLPKALEYWKIKGFEFLPLH